MPVVSINIGSNLGDRRRNLHKAVAEIEKRLGCELRKSSIYITKPWGYRSDSPFFNMEAELTTEMDGEALLSVFREIEEAAGSIRHRNAEGGYADRTLDIDIIYIGDEVCQSPRLTLPHPKMHLRDFVLLPLAELSPHWRHPVFGLTVSELAEKLAEKEESTAMKTDF